jgi:hypothetical protein
MGRTEPIPPRGIVGAFRAGGTGSVGLGKRYRKMGLLKIGMEMILNP